MLKPEIKTYGLDIFVPSFMTDLIGFFFIGLVILITFAVSSVEPVIVMTLPSTATLSTVNAVNVPKLVMFVCAAVVTVAAVPEAFPVTFPVKFPVTLPVKVAVMLPRLPALPDASRKEALEDGCVTKINFSPAVQFTALLLFDDDKIVVLARVAPDAVYVPIPTSQ